MQLFNSPDKHTSSKLLPFRPSTAALRGLDGSPDRSPDLDEVSHDIGVLRRPVPVESFGAPRLQQADGLAHDARNVMTSLTLIAGLLGEPGALAESHQHYAADLQSLTASLATLVEGMANLTAPPGASAGAGKEPVFVREPLRARLPLATRRSVAEAALAEDAGSMVKSCERLLAAIAGPAVTLHISFERGLGVLALGGEDLTRVLINLVKNASEAMPAGGRVAITVRKALGADPHALITVQDTGAGIPAHALGQVFQAGFSSKKTGRRWPATAHYGLGLTIVRDLVEAAGGSVRVSSALKKGTTFELKVPCHQG